MIITGRPERADGYRVTRICDHCGKKGKAYIHVLMNGRKKRGNDFDYCKKCSYIYRNNPQKKGEESPFWKGGKSKTGNGYFRINGGKHKGKYEHVVIYENFKGRLLSEEEKLHHIDMNKMNNNVDNLYLCKNKGHHSRIHSQMEELGYTIFGKYVWFDYDLNVYSLSYKEKPIYDFCLDDVAKNLKISFAMDHNDRKYVYYYLGNRNHRRLHRLVADRMVGYRIDKNYQVHHIDNNTLNNEPDNLSVLTISDHKKSHNSLQTCIIQLYKMGVVVFNRQYGKYACSQI